jgi:chemotaxis protein histidine kinase CheA
MAKVQAKKAAAAAKKKAPKSSKPAPKKKAAPSPAKKKLAAKKPAPAKKKVAPAKKKVAAPKKKAAPPKKKAAPKAAAKKAAAPKKAPAPKKAAAKPEKTSKKVAAAAKAVAKTVAKAVAKTVAKGVAAVTAGAASVPVVAKAAKAVEKRARRPRTRVTSGGPAVANWFSQEKARPSSFIPAPPRAEAPSLVAAPPASSDRLIRPEELHELAVRTTPVRVDIEQGGGRVFISINPIEATLRPGEGIEWDFRYLGGADVTVDEVVIEFDRPSPFGTLIFRSRKPGAARPHRQMSGAANPASAGKRLQYTIRAMTAFKSELANTKPFVNIVR